MKVRPVLLILVAILAVAATALVLWFSDIQIAGNVNYAYPSLGTMYVLGGFVAPNGDPMDGPGMPG
ncbi:hypothetical protein GTO27_06410 [Candidatus Bathyarchaeota archaeon]|nr:hypothetical protein [Candidatus Bathyarchaeota archaeon]